MQPASVQLFIIIFLIALLNCITVDLEAQLSLVRPWLDTWIKSWYVHYLPVVFFMPYYCLFLYKSRTQRQGNVHKFHKAFVFLKLRDQNSPQLLAGGKLLYFLHCSSQRTLGRTLKTLFSWYQPTGWALGTDMINFSNAFMTRIWNEKSETAVIGYDVLLINYLFLNNVLYTIWS